MRNCAYRDTHNDPQTGTIPLNLTTREVPLPIRIAGRCEPRGGTACDPRVLSRTIFDPRVHLKSRLKQLLTNRLCRVLRGGGKTTCPRVPNRHTGRHNGEVGAVCVRMQQCKVFNRLHPYTLRHSASAKTTARFFSLILHRDFSLRFS